MAGRRRCARCGQFNPKPGHGLTCKAKTSPGAKGAGAAKASSALPTLRKKDSGGSASSQGYDQLMSAARALSDRQAAAVQRPRVNLARFGEQNTYHAAVRAHVDRCRSVLSRPVGGRPFDIDRAAVAIQGASARVHQFDPQQHPGAATVYSDRTRALAAVVANKEWSSAAGDGIPDYFSYDAQRGGWYYLNDDVRGFLSSVDSDLRRELPH